MCSSCSHPLFSSQAKFEHSTPWPAFQKTITKDSVKKREERKDALKVMHVRGLVLLTHSLAITSCVSSSNHRVCATSCRDSIVCISVSA